MGSRSGGHDGQLLTPPAASRKRKDDTVFDFDVPRRTDEPGEEPAGGSNRLLAGYLAHEFLTKGTLFGERWEPSAAGATTPPPPPQVQKGKQAAERGRAPAGYAEVAHLLKADGARIPGVVNPSQLARLLLGREEERRQAAA